MITRKDYVQVRLMVLYATRIRGVDETIRHFKCKRVCVAQTTALEPYDSAGWHNTGHQSADL